MRETNREGKTWINRLAEDRERSVLREPHVDWLLSLEQHHNAFLTSTSSDGGKLVVEMEMSRLSLIPSSRPTHMLPRLMMVMLVVA